VSGPTTLVLDIGGTSIKAAALDERERPMAEPVRVPMSYPVEPGALLDLLASVASALPSTDRVSVGFPGVVRSARVLTAPAFVAIAGLGSTVSPSLVRTWTGFDLGGAVAERLARPTLLANDADLLGLGAAEGVGLELVVTLGAGFGTALLRDGDLCPHMEFAHDLFRDDETYNEQLGDAARQRVGPVECSSPSARCTGCCPTTGCGCSAATSAGSPATRAISVTRPPSSRAPPAWSGVCGCGAATGR